MNSHSSNNSFFGSILAKSHLESIARRKEKSFKANRVEAREYARQCFAQMLVEAFPADTLQGICRLTAPVLDVTERQVANWLKGESSPAFEHVVVVGTKLGISKTIWICTKGGLMKEEVAALIGRSH